MGASRASLRFQIAQSAGFHGVSGIRTHVYIEAESLPGVSPAAATWHPIRLSIAAGLYRPGVSCSRIRQNSDVGRNSAELWRVQLHARRPFQWTPPEMNGKGQGNDHCVNRNKRLSIAIHQPQFTIHQLFAPHSQGFGVLGNKAQRAVTTLAGAVRHRCSPTNTERAPEGRHRCTKSLHMIDFRVSNLGRRQVRWTGIGIAHCGTKEVKRRHARRPFQWTPPELNGKGIGQGNDRCVNRNKPLSIAIHQPQFTIHQSPIIRSQLPQTPRPFRTVCSSHFAICILQFAIGNLPQPAAARELRPVCAVPPGLRCLG